MTKEKTPPNGVPAEVPAEDDGLASAVANAVQASSFLLEQGFGHENVYLVLVRPVNHPELLAFGTNVAPEDAAQVLQEARALFVKEAKKPSGLWTPGKGEA